MEAALFEDGEHIVVKWPFTEQRPGHKPEAAGLVRNGRYDRNRNLVFYPLSVEHCQDMRREWGSALRVEKKLSAWYKAELVRRQKQAELSAAETAPTPRLSQVLPSLAKFIGPDQKVAAHWIKNAYRNGGLLADEPGLGKTFSVVAGLIERDPEGPVLIVCPKISVKTVWGRHLKDAPFPTYLARGTRQQREKVIGQFLADPAPTKCLVVVAEMLRAQGERSKATGNRFKLSGYEFPELFGIEWAAVILDESHKLLGAMTVSKGNLMSEGLRKLPVAEGGLRLAVTGTPFGDGGKVEGIFGTLHWCWPDEYPSFWRWAGEHFDVRDEKVFVRGGGGATMTVKRIHGLKKGKSESEFFATLGPRVLRRTLEEVSPEHFGMLTYEEVVCEMTPKQAKLYATFQKDAEVPLAGGVLTASGTLAEMTRMRQLANGVPWMDEETLRYTEESGKLDMVMQRLDEMGLLDGTGTRKVVIASQWNEYLWAMTERLDKAGAKYHLMTGETSDSKRETMMDHFQSDAPGPMIFIMNAKAGGVSITLDAADFLFQVDEMFPPEANEQLHKRISRRSRVHECRVVYFRSEGTIDEIIAGEVARKLEQQLKVMDARRGRDIMREVLRGGTI